MGLFITNQPSPKQWQMLEKLGYIGKQDITKQEASELIDELLAEQRLMERDEEVQIWD